MAAKASGTWLKVASKGGGAKSVFVSNKLGGRAFNEGETITQSELNAHLATASKALEKQGIDAKARFPGTYKQATAKAGSSSSLFEVAFPGVAKRASEKVNQSMQRVMAKMPSGKPKTEEDLAASVGLSLNKSGQGGKGNRAKRRANAIKGNNK